MIGRGIPVWGETKRMLFNKNFLAAWLIACISIAIGQTYPSLKKHWHVVLLSVYWKVP